MIMDYLKMDRHFLYAILICVSLLNWSKAEVQEKVCLGTSNRLSHSGQAAARYESYQHLYNNCTFIAGNLEISFLDEEDNYDLTFLSTIKEVTGYVLITNVHTDYLPLPNLRIIRGQILYQTNGDDRYYSLYIARNYKMGSHKVGIKELRFNSLYEIMSGSVMIFNNYQLCYTNTIDWIDILSGEGSLHTFMETNHSAIEYRSCGECDAVCESQAVGEQPAKHCWGEGPNMCQKLTKRICSAQCFGRCYGEMPNQCCNPECVGGCTGPHTTQCWACKHFKNNNECVPYCPRPWIYNSQTFQYDKNPDATYAYGTLCVKQCPEHLVVAEDACVRSCGHGRVADPDTKVCHPCDGPCPKRCPGLQNEEFVNAANLENFRDCTVIEGSISILKNTFDGDEHYKIPPLHPSNLSIFETVRQVTEYIKIQGEHEEFKSLSFFKNLTTINGRQLDTIYGAVLVVASTGIVSLDLSSMKEIANGRIIIVNNHQLCYADSIYWPISNPETQPLFISNNKPAEDCTAEGHVCDPQCSDHGCWGAGDDQCLSCSNFKLDDRCVETCAIDVGVYKADEKNCGRCHKECLASCSGPVARECDACKNYRDGPFCVSECPESKYPDKDNVCQFCNEFCSGGCTGPKNGIGEGACNNCKIAHIGLDGNVTACLPYDTETCVEGYYFGSARDFGIMACTQCHPQCKTCLGTGLGNCDECVHFKEEGKCVSNCSHGYYENGTNCKKCSLRCAQCIGPTASDCILCKQFKIYYHVNIKDSEQEQKFNCTDKCPETAPYKATEEGDNGVIETVCVVDPLTGSNTGPKKIGPILGAIFSILALLGIIISVVAFWCSKRAKALESKERLAARMSGMCDESEITPLTPTSAKPDMAILRMIKESTLRKGTMVGSGAFGTVYKGFWLPEGENIKIPVAIKVLQEGTSSNQNRELLEEARVMASVNNRYCVPVIGVCMTAQIMLVTPYMPLGCLLDYVRLNHENIGSKVLLDWCTQIASGMGYLEEKGIVHRDLAARNVLVQNPKRVRVTDFGLAKLLDYNEEEFHASGGKMPIKWLALECMQYRIFTHKSDVWSFGITMWELFTYGQRPYENIRARDIPELLEKGERLPQPPICTIDVYMIMIKCWMLDAQSRPSFKELAEEFAKMARDPGRYLVIQGDRLLRLPSHTYDKRDMFRNMSVSVDGPEEIVEAEDYLMPAGDEVVGETSPPHRHHHRSHHHHHHNTNGRLDKVKEENSGSYDNDRSRQTSRENSMDHMIPVTNENPPIKYSSLEAAAAQRKQRETSPNRDSLKSRYSSDPCKIIGPSPLLNLIGEEADIPNVPAPPTPIEKTAFALGGKGDDVPDGKQSKHLKVPDGTQSKHLPVDEDDYLQPSSTSHPKYMDLVQDDYLPPSPKIEFDPTADLPPPPPDPPGYNRNISLFAENPEYFDQVDTSSEKQPLTTGDVFLDPTKDRLRSTTSESDGANSEHDYYNDTEVLSKRSKNQQPQKTNGAYLNTSRTNPGVKYVV